MRRALFWLATALLVFAAATSAFDLIRDRLLGALVGGAGGLSLLYLLIVTEKRVDAKFAAFWSRHWDACDQDEITELNELMDGLVVACNEDDGSEIALIRRQILEVAAEIQSDRRTNRK